MQSTFAFANGFLLLHFHAQNGKQDDFPNMLVFSLIFHFFIQDLVMAPFASFLNARVTPRGLTCKLCGTKIASYSARHGWFYLDQIRMLRVEPSQVLVTCSGLTREHEHTIIIVMTDHSGFHDSPMDTKLINIQSKTGNHNLPVCKIYRDLGEMYLNIVSTGVKALKKSVGVQTDDVPVVEHSIERERQVAEIFDQNLADMPSTSSGIYDSGVVERKLEEATESVRNVVPDHVYCVGVSVCSVLYKNI